MLFVASDKKIRFRLKRTLKDAVISAAPLYYGNGFFRVDHYDGH